MVDCINDRNSFFQFRRKIFLFFTINKVVSYSVLVPGYWQEPVTGYWQEPVTGYWQEPVTGYWFLVTGYWQKPVTGYWQEP